jgi:glutaredoxin|tara:strand:- start:3376 stop:3615 length:240 start_codon:yes stop_codon:yes gene_type:complete
MKTFIIYSKDSCPYCTKIVQLIQRAEQKHVVYKLGREFQRDDFFAEFGEGSTFPQIILEGKKLGGMVETAQYLRENNLV